MSLLISASGVSGYFDLDLQPDAVGPLLVRPMWLGQGAAALGLGNNCEAAEFDRLQANWALLGSQQIEEEPLRLMRTSCSYYSLLFGVPLSVSILAAFDDRITHALIQTIRQLVFELEGYARYRNQRGGGCVVHKCDHGLTIALFLHTSNRADEPCLHAHVLVFNAVETSNLDYLALDAREIFRMQRVLGHAAMSRLAGLLHTLGYDILKNPGDYAFEVAGIPGSVRTKFGTRREQVATEQRKLEAKISRPKLESPRVVRWLSNLAAYNSRADKSSGAELRMIRNVRAVLDAEEIADIERLVDIAGRRISDRHPPAPASENVISSIATRAVSRSAAVPDTQILMEAIDAQWGKTPPLATWHKRICDGISDVISVAQNVYSSASEISALAELRTLQLATTLVLENEDVQRIQTVAANRGLQTVVVGLGPSSKLSAESAIEFIGASEVMVDPRNVRAKLVLIDAQKPESWRPSHLLQLCRRLRAVGAAILLAVGRANFFFERVARLALDKVTSRLPDCDHPTGTHTLTGTVNGVRAAIDEIARNAWAERTVGLIGSLFTRGRPCSVLLASAVDAAQLTQRIRQKLLETKVLTGPPREFITLQRLPHTRLRRLTSALQGLWLEFQQNTGTFWRSELLEIVAVAGGGTEALMARNGSGDTIEVMRSDLRQCRLYRRVSVDIREGEYIVTTREFRGAGRILPNHPHQVARILVDGSLKLKSGAVLPPGYRHFRYAYVSSDVPAVKRPVACTALVLCLDTESETVDRARRMIATRTSGARLRVLTPDVPGLARALAIEVLPVRYTTLEAALAPVPTKARPLPEISDTVGDIGPRQARSAFKQKASASRAPAVALSMS